MTQPTMQEQEAVAPTRPLRTRELLAACVAAGALAGAVIRAVVAEGTDLALVNKQAGVYDPQTVADRRAQQRIVHALRGIWPRVHIVGEEGELGAAEPRDAVLIAPSDIDVLLCAVDELVRDGDHGATHADAGDLDPDELVLWIDPLDGTKKFAARQFDEVSVLLGIAYRRRPIAGVVHLPFHGDHGQTYWGGPGLGVFHTTHAARLDEAKHARHRVSVASMYPSRALRITTSGTQCALVDHALELLSPERTKLGGATGTMVLSVLTGESDAFFRFRNATKRWDICAVEPLVVALGGALVDQHGRGYEYDKHASATDDFDNAHGLVATLARDAQRHVIETMQQVHALRSGS